MIKSIITSDGEEIVYNLTLAKPKNANGQTIVLIHGLGGDLSAWAKLEEILSGQGFNCISLDLRGQGASSRPKNVEKYTLNRLGQDVAEVVLAEKLTQVLVIGHCLGAIVAQYFTIENPEKVKKLVMMTPLNKTFFWAKWLEKKHILSKYGTLILDVLPKSKMSKRYADLPYLNGRSDFSGRRIFSDLARTSLKSYGNILFHVLQLDLDQRINQISAIPTLILFGKKDKVVPHSVIDEYRKYLPDAKIVILESANHQLLLTSQDEVLENLNNWLPDEQSPDEQRLKV